MDQDRGDEVRAQARTRNLARHLNDRHPDTVLFLAQHAAGRVGATAAELTVVDEDGLTLSVQEGLATALVAVPLPGAGADVRSRLGALLRQARAAQPDGPLTSLELQHQQ